MTNSDQNTKAESYRVFLWTVGADGRIRVPQSLVKATGWKPGTHVRVYLTED